MLISVCCNNPDNGLFNGRAEAFEIGGLMVEALGNGCKFTYLDAGRVRISRRAFKIRGNKEWFGNWCWNALSMSKGEAQRLLKYLRESGQWSATCGSTAMFEWFNRDAA